MQQGIKRIYLLDELRGFAIICMVFHHMFLDIGDVLGLQWGYTVFEALCIVQPLFWAIFIITSGVCSRLSRNTVKRGLIVFGAGLAVTFVTAVIMPLMGIDGAQIYFGILSCLGACMIITGLFMPLIKKIHPAMGMILFFFLFFATYNISAGNLLFGLIKLPSSFYQSDLLCPIGLFSSTFYSADYFSIIPWIFMFAFGAVLGVYASKNQFPKWSYVRRSKFLCFVGKNSLWIYLGHQIVLYGIMYLISFIMLIVK